MYKITGIISKGYQQPTNWLRYSDKKLTKSECEKMVDGQISEFKCEKVKS